MIEVKIKLNQVMKNGLMKTLEKIGDKIVNQAIDAGLVRVGRAIERDAKENCPVKTGRLRASIDVGRPRKNGNKREVSVGTNVEYAEHVEYGTLRMAARPFLRSAAVANEKEAQEVFDEEVKKAVLSSKVTI